MPVPRPTRPPPGLCSACERDAATLRARAPDDLPFARLCPGCADVLEEAYVRAHYAPMTLLPPARDRF